MQRLGGVKEPAPRGRWHLRGGKIWARKGGESTLSGGITVAKAMEMQDTPGCQGAEMPRRMEGKSRRGENSIYTSLQSHVLAPAHCQLNSRCAGLGGPPAPQSRKVQSQDT